MDDNDKKISCERTASIVSYLYGEMPESDRNVFETHLAQCDTCTDEFAGVSMARFSVYEWNKLEFAKLQTPQIVIPYESDEIAPVVSWFDKLREAMSFARGLPVAGVGLAAVAIVVGSVMFGPSFNSNNHDLAGGTNLTRPVVIETPDNIAAVNSSENGATTSLLNAGQPVGERGSSGKTPVPVKISAGSRDRKPVNRVPVSSPKTAPRKQIRSVPDLNQFADDEDKTLRLAEMFDDVETSE